MFNNFINIIFINLKYCSSLYYSIFYFIGNKIIILILNEGYDFK